MYGIKSGILSHAKNLIKGSSKTLAQNPAFFIHIVSSWFYFKNINVMDLKIRQGTNETWCIYNDNKVILSSHDKELIEKVFSFLNDELINSQFVKLSEQKPFMVGNYEVITNRDRIIKVKGGKTYE